MKLNLPEFDVTTGLDKDGNPTIYDPIRLKFVAATPEEWVRQHFVNFLIAHCGFPKSLIANEKGLRFNGMLRRCDTVIYARDLRPVCIVEYKRPTVEISHSVFDQIARYNLVLEAPYLIVSNGLRHFCCRFDGDGYTFLPSIPSHQEMSAN